MLTILNCATPIVGTLHTCTLCCSLACQATTLCMYLTSAGEAAHYQAKALQAERALLVSEWAILYVCDWPITLLVRYTCTCVIL